MDTYRFKAISNGYLCSVRRQYFWEVFNARVMLVVECWTNHICVWAKAKIRDKDITISKKLYSFKKMLCFVSLTTYQLLVGHLIPEFNFLASFLGFAGSVFLYVFWPMFEGSLFVHIWDSNRFYYTGSWWNRKQ